jgi:hypothetical protein
MKRLVLIIGLVAFVSFAYAQKDDATTEMQTLFGNKEFTFGGFGGPRVAYSQFNSKDIWLVGGLGAAVVNHSFFFGGGGYGIVNSPYFANVDNNSGGYLEGGYGGFLFGAIIRPYKMVHLSLPILIGGGSLMYSDIPFSNSQNHNTNTHIIDQSQFFVIEPSIEVELNVIRFMRIAAGVSYRYASNLNLITTPNDSFNNFSGSVTLKFGRF